MARRRKIKYWTGPEFKMLKKMAGKAPAQRIARELKRTVVAVRVKASQHGISLRFEA
jgi:hypothetical protein